MEEEKNSHQDTSGAGAEYEQFLVRTKTLQQAPSSWSVAGLEKALNNIGCLNSVCHILSFSVFAVCVFRDARALRVERKICQHALRLDELFPDGSIPMLEAGQPGAVTLSRGQVTCRHVTVPPRATCDCRCGVCWPTCCSAPWHVAPATGTG